MLKIMRQILISVMAVIILLVFVSTVMVGIDNYQRLNKLRESYISLVKSNEQQAFDIWGSIENYAKQDKQNMLKLKQDLQDEAERILDIEYQLCINELESNKLNLVNSIQNTIDSVVHIANLSQGWQGSGVMWSRDIIVTARHVAEGGTDFEITLNDGTIVKATEAISSKKYDIGFIKLPKEALDIIALGEKLLGESLLEPAEFGSIEEIVLGQQIYVIGSPYGKVNFNFVSLGIVSGLNRDQDAINPNTGKDYGWSIAFTSDAAGHPGNSGCPVFTIDGKVRGILVGGYSPVLKIIMPVDLFMDKLAVIEMMFEQRKFYEEEEIIEDNRNYYRQWDLD